MKSKSRLGFSLIEMLIVMTIVGIVSTFVFASFSTVSNRIAFQNQVTSLQYWANDLRSRTFTAFSAGDTTIENKETFVYLIDLKNNQITTFKETDSDYFNSVSQEQIIDSWDFSDTNIANRIRINDLAYYDADLEEWNTQINSESIIAIVFNSGDQQCLITDKANTIFNTDKVTMLKLPIINSDSPITDPIRFGYVHKLSCNLEILNNEI